MAWETVEMGRVLPSRWDLTFQWQPLHSGRHQYHKIGTDCATGWIVVDGWMVYDDGGSDSVQDRELARATLILSGKRPRIPFVYVSQS